MFELDRRQVLAYVAVGAAVLAVGLYSLKQSGGGTDGPTPRTDLAAQSGPDRGDAGFLVARRPEKLVVDVSGAVARPGVYRLPEGSRVIDAIRKAGGPARGAQPQAINRAARLADGQQIVVPQASGSANPPAEGGAAPAAAGNGPVSLGSATAGQLEEIDGIGPVTAQKIIEFRDSKGGLGSIEDLDQVSGIGPVTMESLRSALQP